MYEADLHMTYKSMKYIYVYFLSLLDWKQYYSVSKDVQISRFIEEWEND
jgi:hypothetical protein